MKPGDPTSRATVAPLVGLRLGEGWDLPWRAPYPSVQAGSRGVGQLVRRSAMPAMTRTGAE